MNRKQYQICCLAAAAKQAMIEKEDIKFKAADDIAAIEFRFLPELQDTAMPVDEDGNGYVTQDVTEWYLYCMDNLMVDIQCRISLPQEDAQQPASGYDTQNVIACFYENESMRYFAPAWHFDEEIGKWQVIYQEYQGVKLFLAQMKCADNTQDFLKALDQIQIFAHKLGIADFDSRFSKAAGLLCKEADLDGEAVQLVPPQLPLTYAGLFGAAQMADIFDTENDENNPLSAAAHQMKLDDEYEQLCSELSQQIHMAVMYAVNAAEVPHPMSAPVAAWIEKVAAVYECLQERLSEKRWRAILDDPILQEGQYTYEATWALFHYLRTHYLIKQNIYVLLEQQYYINKNAAAFYKHLPKSFVDYMRRKTGWGRTLGWGTPNALDTDEADFPFEWFSKKGKADFDGYIGLLAQVERQLLAWELADAADGMARLQETGIDHPYFQLYKAMYLSQYANQTDADKETAVQLVTANILAHPQDGKLTHYGAEVLWNCGEHQKSALLYRYLDKIEPKSMKSAAAISRYEAETGNIYTALQYAMDAVCIKITTESTAWMYQVYEDYLRQCEAVFSAKETAVQDRERQLEQYLQIQFRFRAVVHMVQQLVTTGILEQIAAVPSTEQQPEKLLLKHPEYRESMGQLYSYLCGYAYEAGHMEECVRKSRLWQVVCGENSQQSALAYSIEGNAYYKYGKYKEAFEALSKAVQITNSKDDYLQVAAANAGVQAGAYEAADGMVRVVLMRQPEWFPALAAMQLANWHSHNKTLVIEVAGHMARINPKYPQSYELAAMAYCSSELNEDARKILETAKAAGVQTIKLLFIELAYLERRKVSRMKDLEQKKRELAVVKAYVGEETSKEQLAALYYELGQLANHDPIYLNGKGIDYITKAQKLYKHVKYFKLMGNVFLHEGKPAQALDYFEQYLAEYDDAKLLIQAGNISMNQGRFELGLALLTKAQELEPANIQVLEGLYNGYLKAAQSGQPAYYDEALNYLRQLEMKNHMMGAHYCCCMGNIYVQQKKEAEAFAAYDRALAYDANHADSLFAKGRLLLEKGEYEQARYYLTASLFYINELDSKDDDQLCPRFLAIAESYEAQQDFAAAQSWYQRGVQTLYYDKYKNKCKNALKKIQQKQAE